MQAWSQALVSHNFKYSLKRVDERMQAAQGCGEGLDFILADIAWKLEFKFSLTHTRMSPKQKAPRQVSWGFLLGAHPNPLHLWEG